MIFEHYIFHSDSTDKWTASEKHYLPHQEYHLDRHVHTLPGSPDLAHLKNNDIILRYLSR